MFYIHQHSCISPQQTFGDADLSSLHDVRDNKLRVIEPSYEGIPTGILRRMGKAIRLGVGTALPLIKESTMAADGIIIGTGNGGMEDCIKFLNQIIDYEEGMLTPTNFVQSTTNAIAAQIGLLSQNNFYNTTHVHRGLAFENALLDADMLLQEYPAARYLVGGVDEISAYNYNIDYLGGWFKKESIAAADLYQSKTPGSIAGEGAAMFVVSGVENGAVAKVSGIHFSHTGDVNQVREQLSSFISKYATHKKIDLFLSGEDGDSRLLKYYEAAEKVLPAAAAIARFKQLTGEYATVSAVALWLACYILQDHPLPEQLFKFAPGQSSFNRIIIYNTHKGVQHGFILVERAGLSPEAT